MDQLPLKILFFTFSRSDYTSTAPVLRHLLSDGRFESQLCAGGSHFLDRFGSSIEEIHSDGFPIDFEIRFLGENDNSPLDICNAYIRLSGELVEVLSTSDCDCIFILGDRWEMMAVVTVAKLLNLPIIHHSGGDLTQGSSDNQTRYAISTHAHLHLTAHEEHSKRLEAIGEEGWRVKTVGEPALTHLNGFNPIDRTVFSERFGMNRSDRFVLSTFHPTSFDPVDFESQIKFFLDALNCISLPIILTAPNPDVASRYFYDAVVRYADANENVRLVENLGVEYYYSAMSYCEFMIGNSSSGIWEAPSFHLPVINIGERQAGRIRAANVIDIGYDKNELIDALETIETKSFRQGAAACANPYVKENCLELIADFIADHGRNHRLMEKVFVDPVG